MDCFCLGMPIATISTDVLNAIRNDPLIIFYQAGNTSYVTWNVVLEVGCLKPIFNTWLSKAPWTNLMASFQRLSHLSGSDRILNFGNIRVYLKYAISIPPNLRDAVQIGPDFITYGIRVRNVTQTMIDAVRITQNLQLYASGDSHYLAYRAMACTGLLKPEIDIWYNEVNPLLILAEINEVLTAAGRKNIDILQLRLYGKYQLTYPYVVKIQHYAQS
jgi:hypothetical protein